MVAPTDSAPALVSAEGRRLSTCSLFRTTGGRWYCTLRSRASPSDCCSLSSTGGKLLGGRLLKEGVAFSMGGWRLISTASAFDVFTRDVFMDVFAALRDASYWGRESAPNSLRGQGFNLRRFAS